MGQHQRQSWMEDARLKTTGQVDYIPGVGHCRGWGTTTGNGVEDWATGALFQNTSDGQFYRNSGTSTTASWAVIEDSALSDAGEYFTTDTVEAALQQVGQHIVSTQWSIPIPLFSWREATNMDVGNIAANGGILASDTTPILEAINAATDGQQRINWASSNSDPIINQVILPPDLDASADIVVHFYAAMAGATDTPTITVDSFFGVGDTRVVDASGAITGATAAEYTATIAAADVPSNSIPLTLELTPGAHTTDALFLMGTWIEYTRAFLTS